MTLSTYRDPSTPPPVVVELGPVKRPSSLVLVLALAFGIAPGAVATSGARTLLARPARSTLECTRTGDAVRCDALDWWTEGDGFRSREVAVHVGHVGTLRFVHLGGHTSRDCIQFEGTLKCGGEARRHVETLRALPDGERAQLDVTSHEGFGAFMGFASLFGLLTVIWLSALRVLLQRRTRTRVTVCSRHLEVETRWADLWPRAPRTLPRVEGEMARVVMAERGGRGRLPVWRIEYGGTGDYQELFIVAAIAKPIALEHAAARVRAALEEMPRTP